MANLRDIRRRIKSVKNTAQITRAMQLVAAAKMKKAQDQALAGRAYSKHLLQTLFDIRKNFGEESHPFLEHRPGNRELVLVISTDKGLCGAINTNLARKMFAHVSKDAHFITVGRKLRSV
ncbi:MAG: F0F1 ATP synthase subunit gamma, partial [Verrucomicrobia bacterium]